MSSSSSKGGGSRQYGKRNYGGSGLASHSFANECPRCGRDMQHTRDMTKTRRGVWIHKTCAGGADDE